MAESFRTHLVSYSLAMKINMAFKYKLILTKEQERMLFLWMSHLRGLYNLALEQRILNWRQFRKSHSWQDQSNELPDLKSKMPSMWTNSYFVSTVGGVTLGVVKKYVESQKLRGEP